MFFFSQARAVTDAMLTISGTRGQHCHKEREMGRETSVEYLLYGSSVLAIENWKLILFIEEVVNIVLST